MCIRDRYNTPAGLVTYIVLRFFTNFPVGMTVVLLIAMFSDLYYAHLYSYAGDLKEGDRVKAGELIGYMGDTGYGKTEGTRGNFDVHLHVGIYIKTDHNEEMSVNPYWILKWLEKRRLVFTY